jgi:predicted PurR-regulated permease PerM
MRDERGGVKTLYILAGAFVALLAAGYLLRHTLSALLTSLVLAYLLNPLLKSLERRGFDRVTAIILLYGIGAFVLMILSVVLVPYFGYQMDALTHEMPRYVQNVKTALEGWKATILPYYSGEEGAWLLARAGESLTRLAEEVSGIGYERFKGLLFGLFNLVLAPIIVFFMLLYKEFFKQLLTQLIPKSERDYLAAIGNRVNRTLERFILAMVFDCLCVGILSATALTLLDIEFPLLNGLLAGFASAVPFIGAVVAVIPPAFFGYAKSGDMTIIPKVCAAYFLIHVIIEGNLIKPLLMKTTLKLNPLAVIFAVMAMGELLGFWGILLAVPLAAVIKICAGEVRHLLIEEKAL